MQTHQLSNSNLIVPSVCLGTMSFGAHVSEEMAYNIMDRSVELGCNFFDTAEMYAVPPEEKTFGKTEEIIGRWMKKRNNRNKIILATKIVGSERDMSWVRNGKSQLDEQNIRLGVEGSLKRLQTDYLDLYQLHWPDRNVNKFGERNFHITKNEEFIEIETTLQALQKLQQEGKIKHIGVSNETPWGVMEYLRLAKEKNLPEIISIQNNYNLLTRTYETSLSEISYRENIPLLAYSPLAYGVIIDEKRKDGRFEIYPDFVPRYKTERVQELIEKYKVLAHKNNMTVSELAIAFVASQSFVGSVIIGPATVDQLENGIKAASLTLSKNILDEIERIHELHPNICA